MGPGHLGAPTTKISLIMYEFSLHSCDAGLQYGKIFGAYDALIADGRFNFLNTGYFVHCLG